MYKMKNGVRFKMTPDEVAEINQHRARKLVERTEENQNLVIRNQEEADLKLKLGLSDTEWKLLLALSKNSPSIQ